MAIGVLKRATSNIQNEQYKIVTLDGRLDSLEVVEIKHNHRSIYRRSDLKKNLSLYENALYIIAKHNPGKFQELYYDLKNHDLEFWCIANKMLQKIQNEYAFN